MHVITDDFDGDRSGIKVFVLQLAHAAAVNGIGPFRAERRHVKMFCPFTYFFVGGEGDVNIAMRHIGLLEHRQRGHDFRDARFIIGPQQGFAVGGDKRLPQQLVQHREHHRRQYFIAHAQRDIAAAVVFDNLRVNVFTAAVWRGIDMGDKTDGRYRLVNVGGQRRHHRAFFAQRDVF